MIAGFYGYHASASQVQQGPKNCYGLLQADSQTPAVARHRLNTRLCNLVDTTACVLSGFIPCRAVCPKQESGYVRLARPDLPVFFLPGNKSWLFSLYRIW